MRKAIKRIMHAQWPLLFGEPLFHPSIPADEVS